MNLIFYFNHCHNIGDICCNNTCEHAAAKPVLSGEIEINDLPMKILRIATHEEYMTQPVPEGWIIPSVPAKQSGAYFYECEIKKTDL